MTTGETIKKLRTDSGMTQTEFAKKIHTSKQTVYKYEQDIVTNIPYDKIVAIADVFDVQPSFLMGWKGFNPISSRIVSRRKELGLSAEDIAKKAGVSLDTITEWEQNIDPLKISTKTATDLCKALELNPLFLTGAERTANGVRLTFPEETETINETELLTSFRSLNDKGQNLALDYMKSLVEVYKKPE